MEMSVDTRQHPPEAIPIHDAVGLNVVALSTVHDRLLHTALDGKYTKGHEDIPVSRAICSLSAAAEVEGSPILARG